MTEDFKQGFILGLAQKPLYVAVGPVSKSSVHKFIFKVNGGEEFTFPAIGVSAIKGIIAWGDGTSDTYMANSSITHTYNDDKTEAERLVTVDCVVDIIRASAFNNNRQLIRAQIGNGVSEMWANIFSWCMSLIELSLPDSLRKIGGALIASGNEWDSPPITNISVPPNITTWEDSALYYNPYLTTVRLIDGLSSIGVKTFYHDKNLATIYMPNSILSIGNEAFSGYNTISTLLTIYYDGTIEQWSNITMGENVFGTRTKGTVTVVCSDGNITI